MTDTLTQIKIMSVCISQHAAIMLQIKPPASGQKILRYLHRNDLSNKHIVRTQLDDIFDLTLQIQRTLLHQRTLDPGAGQGGKFLFGKLAANVNLRSGPGTGYEAVGLGRRGTAVKVHGQATASGWLQIDALKNTTFYVGRPAIEVDSNALKKLPKLGGKRPLPNQDLITLEGNFISDGKTVRRSGYLYESEDNIKTITHVLYQVKGDELAPEYFVVPHREKLTGFNGKKVNVMGEEYKVKNWDMPVLVVKRIVESK